MVVINKKKTSMGAWLPQGFTLLELLLALVVISSILLLATHYYRITRENTRITETIQMIDQVVDASFKYLEGSPHLPATEPLLPALVKAGFLPKKFENPDHLSPWFTLVNASLYGASNRLNFNLIDIPLKSCYNLADRLSQRFKGEDSHDNAYHFRCDPRPSKGKANFQAAFPLKDVSLPDPSS